MIASGILLCGLVAVGSIFSFAIRANGMNRQMAVGTSLVYDKLEEFRSASFSDAIWATRTGSETLVIAGEQYIRAWQISASVPRTVTVSVYAQSNLLTRRQSELIRATTLFSPTF